MGRIVIALVAACACATAVSASASGAGSGWTSSVCVLERRRELAGCRRELPERRHRRARSRHVRAGELQLEPLGVVARRAAGYREHRRLVEVLLRAVVDVLQLRSRLVHDPERGPRGQQPGAGLRLRLDRDAGDAAELDEQHRPERRVGSPGARVPDDAAVQRLLDEPASQQRHRHVVQRRHGANVDQGQRRQRSGAVAELVVASAGPRRGQGMGRGQRRSVEPVQESRLRDVVGVQQQHGEDPDRRLA